MAELDDLEGQIRRATRRRRMTIGGVLTLVVAAGLYPCVRLAWNIGSEVHTANVQHEAYSQHATPSQIASVDRATRDAEAGLSARTVEWRAHMTDASSMEGRPELGACPITLPLRQEASAQRGGSIDENYDSFTTIVFAGHQGFPHAVAHGGALPDEPPRVTLARQRAAELRESIRGTGSASDFASTVRAANELASAGFWTYDVVFFADDWSLPIADVTGTSFTGGTAAGTAVLYDYASGQPLCAGDVTASTTSDNVQYQAQVLNEGSTLQSMLTAEFDAAVERAIAQGVRYRAGPNGQAD